MTNWFRKWRAGRVAHKAEENTTLTRYRERCAERLLEDIGVCVIHSFQRLRNYEYLGNYYNPCPKCEVTYREKRVADKQAALDLLGIKLVDTGATA